MYYRWGPDPPMGRSNFEGEDGQPTVKYRFAVWVVDSGGPKKSQVQAYSPGGTNDVDFNVLSNNSRDFSSGVI